MNIETDRPSSCTLEIAVPETNHDWVLEIQDERSTRRVPIMRSSRLVIGAGADCDVVLSDPTVSARHCAISTLGNGVEIEDLASRNGTFIGSARVREAWGAAGTTLSLGRSSLVITPALNAVVSDDDAPPLPNVAGGSAQIQHLARQVRRLSQHTYPVLIFGETGTGKELIARALHLEGPRASKPFVVINVSALPRELIESELFGHERGAFTGAVARRAGAFDEAHGGTLFLDEIGELPLEAQPKLLRALDGYEVRRVGGPGSGRRADVRVVAATHVPLEERVMRKEFRRDLFHRLEVFVLSVPPLRERRGDIPPIARDILTKLAAELGPRTITPHALARLVAHDWPGNVRELRNVLYRAADRVSREAIIDVADIDTAMNPNAPERHAVTLTPALARAILREHKGNLSAAARAAGTARTTFRTMTRRR
jgi:DNA-binding NtrC family response regulator